MAPTMERIAREAFPKATRVTDRFHVQKLAFGALQQLRIQHRWEAMEQENNEIELAKETKYHTSHISWIMAIHQNNFSPEVDIFSLRPETSGHQNRHIEQRYFLRNILT